MLEIVRKEDFLLSSLTTKKNEDHKAEDTSLKKIKEALESRLNVR